MPDPVGPTMHKHVARLQLKIEFLGLAVFVAAADHGQRLHARLRCAAQLLDLRSQRRDMVQRSDRDPCRHE